MVFLYILIAILLFLSLKITITITYSDDLALYVKLLFIKFRVVPPYKKRYRRSMSAKKAAKLDRRLREDEEKKRAKKAQKKAAKKKAQAEKKAAIAAGTAKKKQMSPAEILDIVQMAVELLRRVVGNLFRHLRIKLARIRLNIGTGDAATTALVYGTATQTINAVFPLLDRLKQVKTPAPRDIYVNADFCAEETEIDIDLSFSIRIWHLFHIALSAIPPLFRYLFRRIEREQRRGSK